MPRPISFSMTMVAADADGIALSQTPGGAGNLTLNGTLVSGGVATMDVPRHVSVSCAGADAARTFTFTGTDRYGNSITEALAGSSSSITKGTKNFKTVTQVAVDDATAGAVTIGTADELESKWIPHNLKAHEFNVGASLFVSTGGSFTYTLQHTHSDVQASGFAEDDANIIPGTQGNSIASEQIVIPYRATRIKLSAFSSGTLTVSFAQSGT